MDADLVLTSAGVSKGDYDVVKLVLASRGKIVNKLVRMKPARPLAFGTFKAADDRIIPHLGLPGNPVAVVVAFEAFARPAILAMQGKKIFDKPTVQAVMDDAVRNSDNRRVYARVLVYRGEGGEYRAKLSGSQGSGVLTAVAAANGMAICPEDVSGLALGDIATVQMFDWPEILF
jgi:molybdopterin molybdotransferase